MFYDADGYYIIDDFIPKQDQDSVEELLLSNQFPYFYNDASNGEKRSINTVLNRNTYDHHQFVHQLIYNYESQSKRSEDLVSLFRPSCKEFFGCDDYRIFRVKINLNTHHPKTRKIVMPHTDAIQECWSMVYFVNTVPNSYTLIGKEMYDKPYPNKFTSKYKAETKKGRAILFDARRYHSAGKCPDGYRRCIINFMFDEGQLKE
jgi:hypothetical protein